MKKRTFALAGASLLTIGLLTACSSGNNANSTSTYNYVFSSDPSTLDYIRSGTSDTKEYTSNLIDGLLENDQYGNLIPSIAEDWTVSKDGLTYTYKLRKNANWYTNDGEEYAPVTAHDFVAGVKHAADKQSVALYIIQNSIKGLDDYITGKNKDFSSVGVKALDDYTVQYTLNAPETYWNSKTTQSVLAPVNAEFLKSKGDKFGQPTDATSLLYNGPYILKGITSKSLGEMVKNPNYWDKDNVHIDTVRYSFFDPETTGYESLMKGFDDGIYSITPLLKDTTNYEEIRQKYADNIIYGSQAGQTWYVSTNLNRENYTHTKKNDSQKEDTKKALQNKDFRQALAFAFNRHSYAAQLWGEDAADRKLRNLFVPPTFVQVGEKSFAAAVQDELGKLGDEWKGVDLSDGQDGLHDDNKAKAEFEKAKATLTAAGVQFPIHLDIPVNESSKDNTKQIQSIKQTWENAFGKENVIVDIQPMSDKELNGATLQAGHANQTDWDINTNLGWSPDYDDPSSYLDILNSKSGALTRSALGIEPGSNPPAVSAVGLDKYDELIEEAGKEQDLTKRYEKYAIAQAWLTDNALIIPTVSNGGAAVLTRVKVASGPFSWTGDKGNSFKYTELQEKPVTTKEREKDRAKWLEEKAKSNAAYQKEIEKHIEK